MVMGLVTVREIFLSIILCFYVHPRFLHFSHYHPLTFYNDTTFARMCKGCGERLRRSPRYSCDRCNFHLHQSCFELPLELQPAIHSEHRLKLHQKPPYDGETCTCNCCNITLFVRIQTFLEKLLNRQNFTPN